MKTPRCCEYVPLPRKQLQKAARIGHNRYGVDKLSGSVDVQIIVLTPVHIGSGYEDLTDDQQKVVAINAFQQTPEQEKEYIIPGSSIRGAVRSIFEAITESCVRVTRCRVPKSVEPCDNVERLCLACQVFGAPGYLGRVSFETASLRQGSCGDLKIPPLYSPKCHNRGRKFYQHCCTIQGSIYKRCFMEGSELATRIHFSNLAKSELGVLFACMGVSPPYRFPIKLGGGKPVGWGSVALSVTGIELIKNPIASSGRLSSQAVGDVKAFISECINEANGLIRKDALDKIMNQVFNPNNLPAQSRQIWERGG